HPDFGAKDRITVTGDPNDYGDEEALNERDLEREPSRRRSKEAADPRVSQFIRWFAEVHLEQYRYPYSHNQFKDGAIVKEFLQDGYTLEQLRNFTTELIMDDDEWVKRAGFSIGVLKSQITRYATRRAKGPMPSGRRRAHLYDGSQFVG